MLSTLKNKMTYLIGVPLVILGVGIPFLVWGICKANGYGQFPYWVLLASIGFIYILVGLISSDVGESSYCRKNDITSLNDVPVEVHHKFFQRKMPWIYAGIIVLIVLGVFAAIFFFTKQWPLF